MNPIHKPTINNAMMVMIKYKWCFVYPFSQCIISHRLTLAKLAGWLVEFASANQQFDWILYSSVQSIPAISLHATNKTAFSPNLVCTFEVSNYRIINVLFSHLLTRSIILIQSMYSNRKRPEESWANNFNSGSHRREETFLCYMLMTISCVWIKVGVLPAFICHEIPYLCFEEPERSFQKESKPFTIWWFHCWSRMTRNWACTVYW